MRINNNISALNTLRQYTANTNSTSKSMEKLSSGLRINRAGDDAAGLAISEKMRAQIRGIEMAAKNSQDAISLVQTAEGALTETHAILQRMNELAIQASSDTNETIDRNALQSEFSQLASEIDDIASQTKFNNKYLLDGSYGGIMRAPGTSASITNDMLNINQNLAAAGTYVFTYTDKAAETADVTAMGLTGGSVTLAPNAMSGEYSITYNPAAVDNTDPDYAALDTATTAISVNLATAIPGNYSFSWDDGTDTLTVTNDDTSATQDFVIAADTDITFGGVTLEGLNEATVGALNGLGFTVTAPSFSVSYGGTPMDPGDVTHNAAMHTLTFNGVTLDYGTTTAATLDANLNAANLTITAATATVAVNGGAAQAAGVSPDGTVSFSGFSISNATAANLNNASLKLTESELTIQTGANSGETLEIAIGSMSSESLGLTGLSVTNKANAQTAGDAVTNAINKVSTQRANLGAYQNRLEHKINNLDTSAENLQAAESRIRDVDMAQEMVEFTKNNILLQAAQSMLAQANAQPQGVLQLLQ